MMSLKSFEMYIQTKVRGTHVEFLPIYTKISFFKSPQIHNQCNNMSLGQQIFQVEAILDYKVVNRIQLFHIKWKGFPLSQCTWQPLANLQNCMDMVKEFKIRKGLWFKREPYQEKKKDKYSEQQEEQGDDGKQEQVSQTSNVQKQQNLQPSNLQTNFAESDKAVQVKQTINNQPSVLIRQKFKIQPNAQILKMLKNDKGQVFYRVYSGGDVKVVPRKEIIGQNIKIMLDFYEKFLRIQTKNKLNS